MITSMSAPNEQERLLELYQYELLDTEAEEDFDEIVQLASQICNVPMSVITLVDSQRQWFKARVGFGEAETPRELSFCAHAVAGNEDIMVVEDARLDERFHDYPNVTGEPNVRFYAGVPLVTQRGNKLGTLCVFNSIPQQLNKEQTFALKVLANQVMKLAEQRMQNRCLNKYQKRLSQQAEMQNKILSIVAHDVRNPLVSLQGLIELDEDKLITDQEREQMLGTWKKQMDNTMCLLSNLIDWGKVHAANQEKHRDAVNLYQVVAELFEQCNVAASAKGNTLVNNIDPGFLVLADRNILEFLVRNVVTNAIKFTEGGTISADANRRKNKVRIRICDTGLGMDKKQIDHLCQGTEMMISRGTRNETGSGLGLMLVKDFVEMMEGKLSIESEKGKGTTVELEISA
jgi:signal transduction histidine kinase